MHSMDAAQTCSRSTSPRSTFADGCGQAFLFLGLSALVVAAVIVFGLADAVKFAVAWAFKTRPGATRKAGEPPTVVIGQGDSQQEWPPTKGERLDVLA